MSWNSYIKLVGIVTLALPYIRAQISSWTSQQINDTLAWVPPPQLANYSYFLSGFDNEGSPVFVIEYGKWNDSYLLTQFTDSVSKYIEQMHIRMYLAGKEPPGLGLIVIADSGGFHDSHLDNPAFQKIWTRLSQNLAEVHDGENFKHFFFINVGKRFRKAWMKILPDMGRVRNVLEVYGTNALQWMPRILEYIPRGQLPSKYAGSDYFVPIESYP